MSALMLVTLIGVQYIALRSAQRHQQAQLESLAQDAATALGLSLGVMMRGGDAVVPMVVINAAFDRGHYERIELLGLDGKPLAARSLGAGEGGRYPGWFAAAFPLDPPTAESMVASGWRQVGKLRVTVHPRFAYEQLWAGARDTVLYMLAVYLAALLALRLVMRSLLRPLLAIERAAQAVARRDYVQIAERPPTRELARVVEAMNAMSGRVAQAITGEMARAESLQRAAYTDEVSGLLNRRGLSERFDTAYAQDREPFGGVFAMLEIEGLAELDRQLGRARCDRLIAAAGERLQQAAGGEHGFAARWAGPQFVVVMPGAAEDAARGVLQDLKAALEALLAAQAAASRALVRVGGAVARADRADAESLARDAQQALEQARRNPANELQLLPARSRAAGNAAVTSAVRDAITGGRLQLFAQPLVGLADGRALQLEVMARIAGPDGELLPAADFLPVVAREGLARALDERVVDAVLAALGGAPQPRQVAINLSAGALAAEGFIDGLLATLARAPGAAGRLVFELSEHGVVQQESAALRLSAALRAAGFALSIDHFGMHRSSLALIGRLRPAYLKLSAAHTAALRDPGTRFLVDSLARAAAQLEVPLHAQAVEDRQLLADLAALGFTGYQGHAAGMPAPWPQADIP